MTASVLADDRFAIYDLLGRYSRAVDTADYDGYAALFAPDALKRIRADLPLYLIAGDKDPLNGGLAFLTPLVDRYRAVGVKDVTHDFYAGARHEVLNETNRAEVVANLGKWIARVRAT